MTLATIRRPELRALASLEELSAAAPGPSGGTHSPLKAFQLIRQIDCALTSMMARSKSHAPHSGRTHWCKTIRPSSQRSLLQRTACPYMSANCGWMVAACSVDELQMCIVPAAAGLRMTTDQERNLPRSRWRCGWRDQRLGGETIVISNAPAQSAPST
jgi:hypothetical protein